MVRVYIFTHTDLDGVGAASVYLRRIKRKYGNTVEYSIQFVEPSSLHLALRNGLPSEFTDETIVGILDLGANKSTIYEIIKTLSMLPKNIVVEWFDHHKWEAEWINALDEIGVKVFIDTSTCGAGLVYNYSKDTLGVDEDIGFFVEAVCSADLWRWDEWFSTYLYRVVGRFSGAKGDAWKRLLVEEFTQGRFWSDGLQLIVEDYVNKELEGYQRGLKNALLINIGGNKIVFLVKEHGPPNNSLMASYLLSKLEADIAVIIREDGSISFRSRNKEVRTLAVCMNGGGHPLASGGRVYIPFYYRLVRVVSRSLYYKLLRNRVISSVRKCIEGKIEK